MTEEEIKILRKVLHDLAESDCINKDCHFFADGNEWPFDMCLYNRDKVKNGSLFQIDARVFKELIANYSGEEFAIANKLLEE